ncbi:MAG: hypothetical protein NC935_07890 [Candidatus Omnitrophica bacterium]|nr:hypothetical protein [Candidatus Omnitrophota bacterium]
MLTIICGEDSVSSFDYYSSLKKEYKNQSYEVKDINANDLEDISLWMGESQLLFAQKQVFFTQNLNKKLSRKLNLKINKIISEIIKDKKTEVITWEEFISSRNLKFPKGATIKEFKPQENIFKLQDALYPGNLKNFLAILNNLSESTDENFIFLMLAQHLKNLINFKSGKTDKKLQKWQIYKLKNLADKWSLNRLLNFYDSFYKIDLQQKTSNTPFSIKNSLELLALYYL